MIWSILYNKNCSHNELTMDMRVCWSLSDWLHICLSSHHTRTPLSSTFAFRCCRVWRQFHVIDFFLLPLVKCSLLLSAILNNWWYVSIGPGNAFKQYLNQWRQIPMIQYRGPRPQWVNSLAPGRSGSNLKLIIFKLILRIDILSISFEFALRWMPQNTFDGSGNCLVPLSNKPLPEPELPRFISPYGIARPK